MGDFTPVEIQREQRVVKDTLDRIADELGQLSATKCGWLDEVAAGKVHRAAAATRAAYDAVREAIQPTPEQLNMLERFADIYGRQWKRKLTEAWMNGAERKLVSRDDDAVLLRQIRNTFGPRWLKQYRRPPP